ncbi:MAG: DNA primase [Bacteroidetes bacterium]|nr:DNA primase [Bacteroidota bacterium]
MISQQTIDQILNRTDIIEVVGGFIKLKKRGANYLGLCPFHNEKSPSFTVSPTKEIYKCFGCGKSGNTISFLMDHEKISYVEALRWLAAKYQVEIEETYQSPETQQLKLTGDSIAIINQFAVEFFRQQLLETEEGNTIALTYLRERGFRDEILDKFLIGYCPAAPDHFAKAALAKQFSKEVLLKTGLVVERGGSLMDNYRERIIFPIHGTTGKIIGFGARIIGKKENAPKYINTPENELYVKSRILYGSYLGRQAVDKFDECLLVEGYTDVMALHQAGVENVMASGGTSLTPDQLRLIKKYSNNLTILYDGDAAGIKAAMRGLDLALEEGLSVQLVLLPDKEDPDSYVHRVGTEAFRQYIQKNKKDIILFQLEVMLKDAGNDSAKKASAVNTIAESISKINKAEDFTRQQDYIRRSAELLKIDESGLHTLVNKLIREKIAKQEKDSRTVSEPVKEKDFSADDETLALFNRDELHERAMVRCLIEFGHLPWTETENVATYLFNEMDAWDIEMQPALQKIVVAYQQLLKNNIEPNSKHFLYHEDAEISSTAVALQEIKEEVSSRWKEAPHEIKVPTREELYLNEIFSVMLYLKLRKIKGMLEKNQKDLEQPHTSEDLQLLLKTHHELKSMEIKLTQELGTVILK